MKYKSLLDEYFEGVCILENKIKDIPEELLLFKPDEESWSIKDHVLHIVDSEINNFIRWKSILAQPGSKVFVIDEENWTKNLNYKNENLSSYLMIFRLLREITYKYLMHVKDRDWNNNYFIREYNGESSHVTLEKNIEIYKNHISFHIKYIDEIIEKYNS